MGTREEHVALTTVLYKFSQLTSQDYTCANGEKNLFTIHDMRALELKKSSCADRTRTQHPAAAVEDPTNLLEEKPPQTDPFSVMKTDLYSACFLFPLSLHYVSGTELQRQRLLTELVERYDISSHILTQSDKI